MTKKPKKAKGKTARSDGFFDERLILLLGYASGILANLVPRIPKDDISEESLKKITWFHTNVERVVYRNLRMTKAP